MKYYAVIDTNVALLKRDSLPRRIIELVFTDVITPILEIEREYFTVLSRPKFHFTQSVIDGVVGSIKNKAIYVDPEKLNYLIQKIAFFMK